MHQIKRLVDQLFVILPFEKAFYKQFGIEVIYTGHPLLDEIAKYSYDEAFRNSFYTQHHLENKDIIAVLPGSTLSAPMATVSKMQLNSTLFWGTT